MVDISAVQGMNVDLFGFDLYVEFDMRKGKCTRLHTAWLTDEIDILPVLSEAQTEGVVCYIDAALEDML